MNIAIAGLGIIGGSYCKAFKSYTKHTVIGINRSPAVAQQALEEGAIDIAGTAEDLSRADVIILCMYPQACVDFVRENGQYIRSDAIVTDAAGIKRALCPQMKELAAQFGFTFVGSHPMAGKEKNGFEASEAELFAGASFLITPCGAPEEAVNVLAKLAREIGFGTVKITTPEEHDRMIAFTSQLPHVLATAFRRAATATCRAWRISTRGCGASCSSKTGSRCWRSCGSCTAIPRRFMTRWKRLTKKPLPTCLSAVTG